VLLVVLYHAGVVFPGGYIGVDVFFVISGFVIGRLLIRELRGTDRLSLRHFSARRFRRLLPALALMLVSVVLLAPLLAPFGAGGTTNATAAASALFSSNIYLYLNEVGGYFATSADLNPLLHTWSLAVEEQFYFTIPVALLACWRVSVRRGRRDPIVTLRWLVAMLTIASLALCITLSIHPDALGLRAVSFAYFSPFTRAWEFCIGIGLVLLPPRWSAGGRVVRPVLALIGYGGIIACALVMSDATTFPGIAAIAPVLASAVAIHSSMETGPLLRPLILLGDNSYDWYLWHWPLIVFAAALWPRAGAAPLVAAAVLALLVALFTRRLLAARVMPRIRRPVIIPVCGVLLPLGAILLSVPISSAVDRSDAVAAAAQAPADFQSMNRGPCGKGRPLGPTLPASCVVNPDGRTSIVLLGDSNATQLIGVMGRLATRLDARIELVTKTSCPFLRDHGVRSAADPRCPTFVENTLAELRARPRDIVILAIATSAWTSTGGDPGTRSAAASVMIDELAATLRPITETGARTILLGELAKPKWVDPDWSPEGCSPLAAIIDLERCGFGSYRPDSSPRFGSTGEIESTAARRAGAERETILEGVCPLDRCTQIIDGHAVWADLGHLTRAGAEMTEDRLFEILSATTGTTDDR
jgi:peptidoglycan/LPS O-acetylase OafA/YrhL